MANATRCSCFYDGSAPTCPYTKVMAQAGVTHYLKIIQNLIMEWN